MIAALAMAIRSTGARLLDTSADAIHHRSVFTFAGSADEVADAVRELFATALPAIDLRGHLGVHPRIGAVDVVPFVPLAGATMADAVALARSLGSELAGRFDLPVFLYEEAARRPNRRRLEMVRRGGFERLAERMAADGGEPDFGPARPHPTAGATAIGARWPLVAYNINLDTSRLDIAQDIAAAIRTSSGGFPSVKALGLPLASRGIVQVSMNLTNYRETSMLQVFTAVADRAAAAGVRVLESEVIGLVPEAALPPSPEETLRLPRYRVLEHALAEQGLS